MRRLLPLAAVLLAVLTAAPVAEAGTRVRMDSGIGLDVLVEDASTADFLRVTGQQTPEGAFLSWLVNLNSTCFVLICIGSNDGNDCRQPGARDVVCDRLHAGVRATLQGGNDSLDVARSLGEAVTIDAGAGNDRITSGSGSDPVPTGQWRAALGDGDDSYTGSNGQDVQVTGGGGIDVIATLAGNDIGIDGGPGNDTLRPGPGQDSASGGSGNDFILAGAEAERPESDNFNGGSGFDVLDWSARTSGVIVALVTESGGGSGEDDGVAGFEKMLGGSGNDSFLGYSSGGGAGNDVLTGDNGANTIKGGTGADVIRGFGGNDTLIADDDAIGFTPAGQPDERISCSTGTDTVFLDLTDPNPDDAQNCESIDRRAVGEEAATVIASRSARLAGRRVGVRIRCPRAVGRACAGTLTLALRSDGAREPARVRYRIASGGRATVRARLTAAEARRVRRAGDLAAVATSIEAGRDGRETVSQHIRVR